MSTEHPVKYAVKYPELPNDTWRICVAALKSKRHCTFSLTLYIWHSPSQHIFDMSLFVYEIDSKKRNSANMRTSNTLPTEQNQTVPQLTFSYPVNMNKIVLIIDNTCTLIPSLWHGIRKITIVATRVLMKNFRQVEKIGQVCMSCFAQKSLLPTLIKQWIIILTWQFYGKRSIDFMDGWTISHSCQKEFLVLKGVFCDAKKRVTKSANLRKCSWLKSYRPIVCGILCGTLQWFWPLGWQKYVAKAKRLVFHFSLQWFTV